jgi:heavy metal sensor kinase
MSRVPLRLRLTLAFAGAMAVLLVLLGSLLYVRLGDSLLEQVDENLESLAGGIAPLVRETGGEIGAVGLREDEAFVQLLGPGDRVQGASERLTTAEEERRATSGPYFLTRDSSATLDGEPARLRLSTIAVESQALTLVVGASLEDRQEALEGLLLQLFLIGPLALVLTSVAGYVLAGAALRPVEEMRQSAAAISSDHPGRRLPLGPAHDEVRRLGETLNDMLARLEAGLARERRFVADASHELRTPLTALRTELELALRRPRSQAELEHAVRSASDEVERLVQLAEDLLVLARVDDGRLPLSTSNHLVQELVESVAGRYDSRAATEGRSIEVLAPPDWACTGDRMRIEQALGNVVDNALRYGAGTIRIEADPADGFVEIRVTDEGPGFAPDFLPHAFERFSRADVARAEGGSGLGLAIVDAIARAHGGTARAANPPGGGAAVAMRLPAVRVEQPHAAVI